MEPGHSQVPMSGQGSLPSTLAPDLILAPQACIVIGAYWGKRMPEWEWPGGSAGGSGRLLKLLKRFFDKPFSYTPPFTP